MAKVQLPTGAFIESDRQEIIDQYLQNGGVLVPEVEETVEAPKKKPVEKKTPDKEKQPKEKQPKQAKKQGKKED